jgi:hypothetical protein
MNTQAALFARSGDLLGSVAALAPADELTD